MAHVSQLSFTGLVSVQRNIQVGKKKERIKGVYAREHQRLASHSSLELAELADDGERSPWCGERSEG